MSATSRLKHVAVKRVPYVQRPLECVLQYTLAAKLYTFVLYRRDLGDPVPQIETKIDVDVEPASLRDFDRLTMSKNEELWSKRLRKGDLCFVAKLEDGIAGYCWIAFKEMDVDEIGSKIKLKDSAAFIYSVFVFPTYRRKRISEKILEETLIFLKHKKYQTTYAYVQSNNTPSRRAFEKIGFKTAKKVFVKPRDLT